MANILQKNTSRDTAAVHKKTLRCQARAKRDQLSAKERFDLSRRISERFIQQSFFASKTIFFIYCNYLSEVATNLLIQRCLQAKKQLSVPLMVQKTATVLNMCALRIIDPVAELVPGYRGIPEPGALAGQRYLQGQEIEVAVLPGLAFDRQGNRLGYGGGCYDRFLAQQAPQAIRVGLAFSCQLVDMLPVEPHDLGLHFLLTEHDSYIFKNGLI